VIQKSVTVKHNLPYVHRQRPLGNRAAQLPGSLAVAGFLKGPLDFLAQRGKDNVNLFANIKDVHVWCSISEDHDNNVWRVSIRSKNVSINDVARVFEGGGHPQASGAKLADLDQLPRLIEALEALL
jgi:nanoRNase/pAp phosphatase (c-di-AMP/oligoRNAs hydrolase)